MDIKRHYINNIQSYLQGAVLSHLKIRKGPQAKPVSLTQKAKKWMHLDYLMLAAVVLCNCLQLIHCCAQNPFHGWSRWSGLSELSNMRLNTNSEKNEMV